MIFIAKTADFSAKNIGSVEIDFDYVEPDTPSGDSSVGKVTMIEITNAPTSITERDTFTLSATVYPSTATDKTIMWSVSPTANATIDINTGAVTAVKAGTITVTAKATDGSNVKGTATITINARTKDDCSDTTKTVLGYYGTHHTDEQALAVDDLISALGGNNEGSIWSKIDVAFMPFLSNNVNTAFINAKNGKDHMEYTSSGKINATNNSIEWASIYSVTDGCVKTLDNSNTNNTLNIPIYRFNNSTTGITGAKYSLLYGGGEMQWAGGTGCMIPVTQSQKIYTANATTERIGADFSTPCIKGMSVNWVSETEGFENTLYAPTSKVSATYGDQTVFNTFATRNSGSAKHWNTYGRCYDQFYLFILAQYLTSTELALAVSEFDKVAKVFNVDQSK